MNEHAYFGHLDAEGKAYGNGVIKYMNGSTYEGTFLNDKRHGLGIWTWADGTVIVGEWQNNNSCGQRTIWM